MYSEYEQKCPETLKSEMNGVIINTIRRVTTKVIYTNYLPLVNNLFSNVGEQIVNKISLLANSFSSLAHPNFNCGPKWR